MAGLNAKDAMIFRITHIDNLPWILDNGLHARSSTTIDTNFINIGSSELITKRKSRDVPITPHGTLNDYVPFYFTHHSIMLLNIHTGYYGVTQRPNEDIVILVSSIPKLIASKIPFVFTNGHAYMQGTDYFNSSSDLDEIDWKILKARDFAKDANDPGKKGRYQAEALAHKHVPIEALLGMACYNDTLKLQLEKQVSARGLTLPVKAIPGWYFK